MEPTSNLKSCMSTEGEAPHRAEPRHSEASVNCPGGKMRATAQTLLYPHLRMPSLGLTSNTDLGPFPGIFWLFLMTGTPEWIGRELWEQRSAHRMLHFRQFKQLVEFPRRRKGRGLGEKGEKKEWTSRGKPIGSNFGELQTQLLVPVEVRRLVDLGAGAWLEDAAADPRMSCQSARVQAPAPLHHFLS